MTKNLMALYPMNRGLPKLSKESRQNGTKQLKCETLRPNALNSTSNVCTLIVAQFSRSLVI